MKRNRCLAEITVAVLLSPGLARAAVYEHDDGSTLRELSSADFRTFAAPEDTDLAESTSRVVFVRPKLPGGKREEVFLDNDFLGELPRESYLETTVASGSHLLSGRWIHFRPAREYLFVLTGDGWVMDSLAVMLLLEDSGKISPPSEAEASLREQANLKRYEKALRRAGDPAEPELPAIFSRIFHSRKLLGFKNLFRTKTKGGILRIDSTAVSFVSGSKNLSIPVAEINGVGFAGFRPNDPDPWLVISVGKEGDRRTEFFSGDTRYNKIFAALREATGSY